MDFLFCPALCERYIITKLKYACGPQFTSKLEGMITDIGVSGASVFAADVCRRQCQ